MSGHLLVVTASNSPDLETTAQSTTTIECDSISNYARGRPYCIINDLRTTNDNQTIVYAPSLFSTAKRELLFDRCRMHAIPAGIFSAFPNLRTMFTWNAGIQVLRPHDLRNAQQLRNIDLSQNNISQLVESIFFSAIDLEYINLAANRIDSLPKLTFHGLVRLRFLHLDHNRIEYLAAGTFDVMPRLEVLYADHNRIRHVAATLFARNTQMHEVHLHSNRIEAIDGHPFAHLRQLDRFRIDDNPVLELDYVHVDAVFTDVRNVSARGCLIGSRTRTLLASDNRIGYVLVADAGAENKTSPAIEHLDLHANRLRSFANLTALHSLSRLDVSDNDIEDLGVHSFAHMPWLVELRLRRSGLRAIGFGLLSHKSKLRWLDVSHNRLRHVELNRFTGLQAVRALFLEGNRLTHIDLTGFRQYFPALQTIGLAQNPWNCTNLAAAVKVLEANAVELNSVGLARNRTNIKGIPCEAMAMQSTDDDVTDVNDGGEIYPRLHSTASSAVDGRGSALSVSDLDESASLVVGNNFNDLARTGTAVNSHINDGADGGDGDEVALVSGRKTATTTMPTSVATVPALPITLLGGNLFTQLVALRREATAAAERSAKVAASLQSLLDHWSGVATGA